MLPSLNTDEMVPGLTDILRDEVISYSILFAFFPAHITATFVPQLWSNLYASEDFTGSGEFGAAWPGDLVLRECDMDADPGDCGGDLTGEEGAEVADGFRFDASRFARRLSVITD